VQQGKWRAGGEERLARQMQHHRRVLADAVEEYGLLGFRDDFPQDVNALGFEALEVSQHGHLTSLDYS
jgi:hypothetical protein